ncbi:TonB-dependent receptor [uncultured Bacteroides sp.]|uniref:SusC/RagA family TonB-linked outer membrane protein n=1 Tax=uncultured Bacteroides sp. TaxID=162156 RepID=UPI0025EE2BFB|nr:TonB-dependent receptor [uncultured Bacteroides sp.]
MNKLIIIIIAVLLATFNSLGQNVTVRGVVRDNFGPVIGATVMVEGTTIGVTTDMDGNFVLDNVPDVKKAVLVVRYVGMNEVKERLDGRTSGIVIEMTESSSMLDDVVVIGYGTQKRGNLTGSISSVSGKILEKSQTTSAAEAIVGKLPGVQVTTVDGSPDAEVKILVRGGGSITQDNSPLIILDGFEVSSLNDIPPTDIESIEVLKDAASTAIYGARGANGVVLVTTKNPTEGKVSVSLNMYAQTKTLSNKLDVMDPYEFVLMQYESARQKSSNPTSFNNKYGYAYEHYIYQGDAGTDWQDEVFGTNPVASYIDLSVNGGTDKAKYKLTFIHQDQPSVMVGNGLKQNNLNASFNFKPFKFVSLEYRTRLLHKEVDGSGTEGVSLLDALRQAPTEGLDEYMTLPEDDSYFDPDDLEEVVRFNPKEESEKNYKKRINKSLNTMGAVTWEITKGMTLRNEFGYENSTEEQRKFWGMGTKNAMNNNNQPMSEWIFKQGSKWQLTNVLNYNFTLGDDNEHDIRLMLGQEMKHQQTLTKTFSTRYFPENTVAEQAFDNLSLGTPYQNSSSATSPSRISSFFGRFNYGFADKYLATITLRADGSSKFSSSNRWGFFPAAAFAWRISNEDFLMDNSVVSNLKLRLSYGASGNDRIDADLYQKLYGVSSSKPAGWGETSRYYYQFYNTKYVYNPDVKWETTITRNLGIDFGFFKERLSGTIDIYWNTVKDLLVPSDIPGYTGFTKLMTNVGQTSNRGIELQLNAYIIEKKDFSLNMTFNIGHNKNRIDRLASGEKEWILSSGWASDLMNADDYRAYVGGTSGLIYGYVNDGFYTMDDFESFDEQSRTWKLKEGVVDSSPLSGDPRPGNAKFKKLTPVDSDSQNPYQLTDADRTVIGETTPKFSGGFGINSTFKGFDLSLFFNFMYDFDVFNANKVMLTTWADNHENNFSMEVASDKRWRNFDDMGNEIRYQPEILAEFNKNATMWNPTSIGKPICMSYAVEDGSFLRLNTATLGYTLPNKLTKKVGINKVRFYIAGSNLFTITGYSGYDPEVDIATGLTPNIDNNRYPRSRTYTFGAQLTF